MEQFSNDLIKALAGPQHERAKAALEGLGDLALEPMIAALRAEDCSVETSLQLAEVLAKISGYREWLIYEHHNLPEPRKAWFAYALLFTDSSTLVDGEYDRLVQMYLNMKGDSSVLALVGLVKLDPSDRRLLAQTRGNNDREDWKWRRPGKLIKEGKVPFLKP